MSRSLHALPSILSAVFAAALLLPTSVATTQESEDDEGHRRRDRSVYDDVIRQGRGHHDDDEDDDEDMFDDEQFGDDDNEEELHARGGGIPELLSGIILNGRQREALLGIREQHMERISAIREALASEHSPRAEPRALAPCWDSLPMDERRALVGTDPEVRRERSALLQDVRSVLTPRQRARFNVNARRWTADRDQHLAQRRAHAHC